MDSVIDAQSNTDLTGDDVEQLQQKVEALTQEVCSLKKQVVSLRFSLQSISMDDKKVVFYTGFPTYASLEVCFEFLRPSVHELMYWNGQKLPDAKVIHRQRTLPPMEEFFLVLVRLRLGILEQDLADRLRLSCSTVSRIFTTWINFLFHKFRELPLWPPREVIR